MSLYFTLLIVMTIMGSVASFFLKKASGVDSIVSVIKEKNLYIGGFLYLGSALLNIYVLIFLDYSVVLPLTSLTYIWTMIISAIFLKEKITARKVIGIILITLGAVCVSL